jgi:hypothetical protein
MNYENIFSALAKYNSAMDENYLTEAFVFVINALLERDRLIACEFLNRLCVTNSDFSFYPDETISISTQEVTEQGTPGIRISSNAKLIFIEVKHDSPLGIDQISRYKAFLSSSIANIKHVILLTRFAIDIQDEREKPYKHVRWFEIYNWLSIAKDSAADPISIYLIESMQSFLEVKQMSLQKVEWEYINGVPAFVNLMNLVEVAILGASLAEYKKSPGWDFKGYLFSGNLFWVGVFYNDPLILTFIIENKKNFNSKQVEKPTYPIEEDRNTIKFKLNLQEKHFFSLNKDEQLEELTRFIKTAYAEAQLMKNKD